MSWNTPERRVIFAGPPGWSPLPNVPRALLGRTGAADPAAKRLIEAESSLERGRWAGHPRARALRGDEPRMSGPAAVQALHRAAGAVSLDDARAHRDRDAQGMSDALSLIHISEPTRPY